MTAHGRKLITMTAIGLFAVSGYVVTNSRQAVAQSRGLEVIVANTPLPVEGAVSASQSGAWNVGVSGNVDVANTPQVRVINAPTVQLAGGTSVDVTNPRDDLGLAIPLVTRESRFGSTTQFVSSQPVRSYLFPGGNITIQLDRTFVSENTAVLLSFSLNREPF